MEKSLETKKKEIPPNDTTCESDNINSPKMIIKKQNLNKLKLLQLIRKQPINRWYNQNIFHREQRIQVLFGILQKTSYLLELQLQTFCLAVNIFDAMISKFPINEEQMFSLALVALQVASKVHEMQGKMISYKDIDTCIWKFGVDEYCRIEKNTISHLNYRVNLVCPNDFLQVILDEFLGVELAFFAPYESTNENTEKLMNLVFNLHLITLVEYEFYKFHSLAVAVSILILSRNFLGLEPWTREMAEFVGISQKHVQECMIMLYQRYKDNFVFYQFEKTNNDIYQNFMLENNSDFKGALNSACPMENTNDFFLSEKIIEKYIISVNTDI